MHCIFMFNAEFLITISQKKKKKRKNIRSRKEAKKAGSIYRDFEVIPY